MQKIKTSNRNIQTKIPAPGTFRLIKKLKEIESRSMHGQLPIVWSKALDHTIYDIAGNKFIDFTSTIFVTNVGHANPQIIKNVKSTLDKKLLHSYAYIHNVRKTYIKKLLNFAGKKFEKAFLLSAGTEATEAALKLMRLNGKKKKKNKLGIICLEGNWHGRTMGAQLMSGSKNQKKWIGFDDRNIHHIPFPYPWLVDEKQGKKFFENSLKKLSKKVNIKKDIAGIMLETFQGWGAIFYPKSFVKAVRDYASKNNVVMCFDEMQAGFGRTGKNFGFQNYNIIPDIICCGKGMGGGVPLSGVIGKKDIMDLPEYGDMSSTNSANPISCSAGIAVLDELNSKKIVRKTLIKGKYLKKRLNKIKLRFPDEINFVSSKGLIAALIFKRKKNINHLLREVCMECMRNGLLVVYTGRESIKIGPPLIISNEALREGLDVLEKSIVKVFNDQN